MCNGEKERYPGGHTIARKSVGTVYTMQHKGKGTVLFYFTNNKTRVLRDRKNNLRKPI